MQMYTSLDAAEEIGTTPRLLRRFIRENDSWKNATHAGRYSFTTSEMEALKKQFQAWQGTRSTRRTTSRVEAEELFHLDEDKGIRVEDMMRMSRDPFLRKLVHQKREERRRKLNDRIKEVGLNGVSSSYEMEDA
jgi:hypothetical protein